MAVIRTPSQKRINPPVQDDATLALRIGCGDADALASLYDRYSRVVYSFAMRMLGDPGLAEELTQEVFLRIWRQGGQYQQSRGALLTWILSITHNMAIDEIRRQNRRPKLQEPGEDDFAMTAIADHQADVEQLAWLGALRGLVREALGEIPAAQREVVELAYFAGLTQREIAARLDEPLGTIKTRMRLALLKLRERLGPLASHLALAPLPLDGDVDVSTG
jgi:RNA polymerase sigma-70 factor (ECF subfamily)